MFHWICPECGQEIAPGVKECPVCEPQVSAAPAPSHAPSAAVAKTPEVVPAPPVVGVKEVEVEVETVEKVASVEKAEKPAPTPVMALMVLPKEPVVPKEPVLAKEPAAPVAAEPEVAFQPEAALEPEIVLQPQVVLQPAVLVQPKAPAKPELQNAPEPIPAEARPSVLPDVPRSMSPAALASTPGSAATEPETFADRLADLAERLHGERIPYTVQQMIPASPVPVAAGAARPPIVIDVAPSTPLLAAPPTVLLLAEPQPPPVAAGFPTEEVFHPNPAAHSASQQPTSREQVGAEASTPNPVLLPDRPGRSAAPALAPLLDYCKAADRLMRPVAFVSNGVVPGAAEPKITLPGPALPRELMSLQAAGLVPLRRARWEAATANRYGWKARFIVLGILLTAGLAATYTVLPGSSTSNPPKPGPDPGPEKPISARSANSLARLVEVTGIRFLEVNKRPEIHYLVVNHSNAPLSSVTVYVTLRSSNWKPGQPPLSRFSFRSPILAAFEAKEMASPIERVTGPLELPEWQDLHVDVEVQ